MSAPNPRQATDKAYLGDGVYVGHDNVMVCLTTSDGIEDTNTIYLDSRVALELCQWLVRTGYVSLPGCAP